jgi:predicted acyl esterase
MNKIEYYMPAIRMAQNGYIVATYTARGVSPSTGINDAAGPNDMKDITSIIDFVLENYPADKNNIGMGGISMGAIRSYLGCLSDSRIKTIAAMSGTVDFVQNTYKQDTPNMGMCLGDPPYFTDAVNNLINRTKIDETLKWLDSISAIRNLDKYSEMERPVSAYMSNNYDDSIMDNNSLLEFFTRLPASAKVIDLNDGEHIFPEGLGCAGIPERTWTNVYKWFDYYLKAKKSDILERINTKKVGMQLRGVNERLYFEGWPSDKIETREFYLQPRQIPTAPGRLEASPAITAGTDSISSGAKSPLGLIPDPSILDQLLHLPRTVKMGRLDPRFTSVYESSALDSDIIAAGVPVLELDVASSQPAFQVVAFLLDVNAYGYGTMISHSPWTIYDAKPGVSRHLKFEFDVFAGRIAKNHRLALVIGTSDGRFGFADNPQFVLSFGFAGKPVLKLPVTSVEPVGETSG